MNNKFNNVVFIMQPHYNSSKFRVDASHQLGEENYICVTCSPSYNGVWKYNRDVLKDCEYWYNNGLKCWCVPISKCTFVKRLEEINNENTIKIVKKQQSNWVKTYKQKPDWLI